jgi:hypothetical protein
MSMTRTFLTAAAILWLLSSCIVSDQLDTLTIRPDGSADWVRVQSNIHSSEKGQKGAEELKAFIESFEARRDPDLVRIREAGGEVLEARLIRREEPCATLVAARLPGARALEAFSTLKDEKGEPVVRARFREEGPRRRLTLAVKVAKKDLPAPGERPSDAERRRAQADGISETRVAVAGGRITASHGFEVARDERSALLDIPAIQDLLLSGGGEAEAFLEWELTGG